MKTTFMSLLTELGGLGTGSCYKHVAPNGASIDVPVGVFNRLSWLAVFWRRRQTVKLVQLMR